MYQIASQEHNAWRGTLVQSGGRTEIKMNDESSLELDAALPVGETGMLIWIRDDITESTKEI